MVHLNFNYRLNLTSLKILNKKQIKNLMMMQKSWTCYLVLSLVQFSLATNCTNWFECVGSIFKDFTPFTKVNLSETSANGTVISVIDLGKDKAVNNVFEGFKNLPNAKESYVNNKTDIITFDLSKIFDLPLDVGFFDKIFSSFNKQTSIDISDSKPDNLLVTKYDNKSTSPALIQNMEINKTTESSKMPNNNTTKLNKIINSNLTEKNNTVNKKLAVNSKSNETINMLKTTPNESIITNKNKTGNYILQNNDNVNLSSELHKSISNTSGKEATHTKEINYLPKVNQSMVDKNDNNLRNNTNIINNTINFSYNIANLLQDELDVPGPSEDVKEIFFNFNKFTNDFKVDNNKPEDNNAPIDFGSFFRNRSINPFENSNTLTNYANIFENLGFINGPINSNANIVLTKTPTIIKTSEVVIPTENIKPINKEGNIPKTETHINKNLTLNDYLLDYYEDQTDDSTDYPIIDYVELYKDTTNEKVNYVPTERTNLIEQLLNNQEYNDNIVPDASVIIEKNANYTKQGQNANEKSYKDTSDIEDKVFPWIVTIFLKNSTSNEFSYACDGALLSSRYVLTAAQCVSSGNLTNISPLDLLVIAGKRSLRDFSNKEKALKIITISLHENYTYNNGVTTNDLAILQTEEAMEINEFVQPFSALEDDVKEFHSTVTTAWNGDGSLVPVALKMINCEKINGEQENVYCCTYENEVTGCPSYGGLHAVKIIQDGGWFLKGIYNGDINKRAPFCFQQIFTYTSINHYSKWISKSIKN